jgi:hypothetical protein
MLQKHLESWFTFDFYLSFQQCLLNPVESAGGRLDGIEWIFRKLSDFGLKAVEGNEECQARTFAVKPIKVERFHHPLAGERRQASAGVVRRPGGDGTRS